MNFFPSTLQSANGQSNGAILGPCATAGAFCQSPYLYGPSFFRADWSLQKLTKLSEKLSLTLRADFEDAFNNQNFSVPASDVTAGNGQAFGRIFSAYSDFTSTQDPGGRFIQFQARIDF